jgi:hypothetical protein
MKLNLRRVYLFFRARFEAFLWIAGLLLMAFMAPSNAHSTLCPFSALGLGFCPGCGLGHSISYLARGDFQASFMAHPLGLFAVVVLLWRIVQIFRKPVFYY